MKRIVFLAIVGLSMSGMLAAPPESPRQPISPPPAALQAGYTRLAFDEEFNDDSGIDLQDTRKPGFNFYPRLCWGNYVLPAKYIVVKQGILHLYNPQNNAQADLFSAVKTGDGQFTGFAAGGGAYFEASIAFDPDYQKKNPGTKGFPAFWSNPVEHHFLNTPEPYNFLEMDHMEYCTGWCPDLSSYMNALVKWTTNKGNTREFVDPVYQHRFISTPPGTDYNHFNTFGALWVPGKDGREDTYFNNELRRSLKAAEYPMLQAGDQQHFMVILGCGQWPIRVDWVRVWMKPE